MSINIEHIFYINLKYRKDRREHIEKILTERGLMDKTERYEALYTPNSGIVGCSYSHLNVLKLAKERGYKNVLILEDDFEFVVNAETFETQMQSFFSLNIEYNVCMLAYIVQNSTPVENTELIKKVLDAQTASGYLVNSNYFDELIYLYEWSCPLLEETNYHWLYANDMVWKQLQPKHNWYYFTEPIGRQMDGYSDNKQCYVKYE